MPSLDDVVAAICRMPLDRYGKDSHVDLVERSGYLDHRREVTVERIYDCLANDPALIDAWQDWCDDNRSTPAWYFRTLGPGEFEVGHFNRSGTTTVRLRFDDRQRACAEYMLRDLEMLGVWAEHWLRPWSAIRKRLGRWRPR